MEETIQSWNLDASRGVIETRGGKIFTDKAGGKR